MLAPRLRRWGASEEEARRRLPGDELVASPTFASTRAVTIAAPPAAVWPWLVQMGQGRGGLYSYDRLENLFGLDVHSADRIVPELQQLNVGDRISLGKDASSWRPGARAGAEHSCSAIPTATGAGLRPRASRTEIEPGSSYATAGRPCGRRPRRAAWSEAQRDFGFAMERKMLHGLKERAEGNP